VSIRIRVWILDQLFTFLNTGRWHCHLIRECHCSGHRRYCILYDNCADHDSATLRQPWRSLRSLWVRLFYLI